VILNIEGQKFVEVKNISHILKCQHELLNVVKSEDTITGVIQLNAEFFLNNVFEPSVNKFEFSFVIEKNSDQNCLDLKLKYLTTSVLDNQGIQVDYQLELNIEESQVTEAFKQPSLEQPGEFDNIKDEIKDEVDKSLNDVLKRTKKDRKETNDKGTLDHMKGIVTDTAGHLSGLVTDTAGHAKEIVVDSAAFAKGLVVDSASLAKDIVTEAGSLVKEVVGTTAAHAKEIAGTTVDFSKEVLSDSAEFLKTTSGHAVNAVTDAAGHVKGIVTDTAGHVKEILPDVDDIKNLVGQAGNFVKITAQEVVSNAKDLASSAKSAFNHRNLKSRMSTYKVCYIKDENDLEKISQENNVSIEQLYRDNNYSIKDIVIIKENE